jgi:hypothetical protein
VDLNLVSSNILDENGVKTMPVLIPAPNSGSIKNIERYRLPWDTQTKKTLKRLFSGN